MTGRITLVCSLLLSALVQTGVDAREEVVTRVPPALVTESLLEAKLTETDADPGLDGETKSRLVELYRRALSNLEELAANRTLAEAFAETTRTAPEQTLQIRERLDAAEHADPMEGIEVGLDTPISQIERQLKREQADRAAADAQRAELERQRAYQENRPAAIRHRLTAAQEEQEAIAAALQAELAGDTRSALLQARRWSLETRYLALSSEIQALDQELISLPMRLELLAGRRAEQSANTDRIEKRVEALQTLVNARRQAEAKQARADAQRMLEATRDMDPALGALARQNAALTDALADIVEQSDRLDAELLQAERLAARTRANFERARTAKAIGVPTVGLGALLLEHRAALPDFEVYARRARALKRQIAAINLTHLRHLEEAERLTGPAVDREQGAAPLAGRALAGDASAAGAMWDDLMKQRRGLLGRQLEAEDRYLERLHKLQTTEERMLEAARNYDLFLTEQLFWLPTGARTRLTDIAKLPAELRLLLAPETWSELVEIIGEQVAMSPVFWLTLLLSAGLLWKRRVLIAAIRRTAAPLPDPGTNHFGHTLQAMLLTLSVAAPLPLVLGVTGWLLLAAPHGTELSLALGTSLVRIALVLYGLWVLRAICLPDGLATAHFDWADQDVRRLDRELRWLAWTLIPMIFVMRTALSLNPAEAGGLVTRIGLLFAALALGLFFYRVFHPKEGLLREQRKLPEAGLLYRAFPLWFPLLIAFPTMLLVLVWSGYIYTAHILSDAFAITLAMIAILVVMHALAARWLTLTHGRLAVQVALEQQRQADLAVIRQARSQATEAGDLAPSEFVDLDLETSSEHSLALLRIAIAFIAAIGFYLIWSRVFPALGILDEVTLWHRTVTQNGGQQSLPITLADLGMALLYLIITAVLARRLPALLNMILARRLEIASASRYTITTLTNYVIIAIGTVLALNTIGAQWSQLQWLVAALGVGIGFGLQEIVANFVSGLIILFERPIRVGDIVTVGDTDGVVTKIRIRATTIRNWDRKELVVPNKEFITGRLLNWSLSDQVTRLMVTVGVAYGTDVEKAHALMREAAEEHARVLDEPKPILTFEGFGDNSLTLVLRAYIDDLDHRLATITDLHKAIYRKFRQAGISIAFPQRDLHLDTREPLRIKLDDANPSSPPRDSTRQA
jgi:potassium-dependent mechanosensitive channel